MDPNATNGRAIDSDFVGNLRTELIESQKARTDFTKWKGIMIAGVGAAAIGVGTTAGMPLLLVLLPIGCLYVDIMCHHNDIRMMVIGRFLRGDSESDASASAVEEYERLCQRWRPAFSLETFALTGTTVVIAALVAAIGLRHQPLAAPNDARWPFGLDSETTKKILVHVSVAVIGLSLVLWQWKRVRLKLLWQGKKVSDLEYKPWRGIAAGFEAFKRKDVAKSGDRPSEPPPALPPSS